MKLRNPQKKQFLENAMTKRQSLNLVAFRFFLFPSLKNPL